ncbi:protein spitz-like [Pocillopora damicornis]|uniref:protein spitz-like n=1 Tax=Pocillopora damicornis TaxID=46731 RepID=UPI000F54EE6D|nr:protein spitz-like [Pocillopora damicornis]
MKIVLILIGAAWVVCATVEAGKGKACDNGGTHKLPCTAEEDQEMQCLNGGTCFALRIGQDRARACHCLSEFTGERCQYRRIDPDLLHPKSGD